MPVKLFSGEDCVKNNPAAFRLGKKCLIVTGKNSAKASGALDDVTGALDANGTEYLIFDKINENPLLSVCENGGRIAAEFGAEFIVGIGGGSALDASKAVAAFAVNAGVSGDELFDRAVTGLPIIAIPTTAGTGSEANSYSVLSLDGENKKRTFKSPASYPKAAFLDAKYTLSLNAEYTLSTALDAFCHSIESYLSPKSTVSSELYCEYAAREIYSVLKSGTEKLSYTDRERLLFASCAAGIAIGETGTGFPHPMGYNLTMFRNVPHGKACAAFIGKFIEYTSMCDAGKQKISRFSGNTKIDTDEMAVRIPSLANVDFCFDDGEIDMFIEKVKTAGNFANNPYIINETEMRDIYRDIFKEK